MIKFPCKCGNVFNLTEDMAGGLIQCTRCGLLNDIPSLEDAPFINEDGTFELEEATDVTDGIALPELHEAFSPSTVDAQGREKDLRNTIATYDQIDTRALDAAAERVAPKYDPATGELIRPLEVKDEAPTPVVPLGEDAGGAMPVAAIPVAPIVNPKTVGYALRDTQKKLTPFTLAIELLMPANVIVLFFLFLFYVFTGIIGTFIAVGSLYFQVSLQVLNFPLWLILAHYGCVIEDTGPDNREELPRPLRHFALSEDIWNPFFNVALAAFISYAPAFIAAMPRWHLGSAQSPLVMLLGLFGCAVLPAVLLTTVTGVSLLNLRPDRVASVMRICGADYIMAVGIYMLALVPTVFYLVLPKILPANSTNPIITHMHEPYVTLPLLAVSVYLGHYFCWLLGLMYRDHHDEFPWLMQRHVKDPMARAFDVVGRTPREPRRAQKQPRRGQLR
ncbi:MAG TPA: hypothetical protein VLI90_20155 [Tepidisphaeraceae bacterium]|nr:hypothetical protein [Tepidisphaeraceae bacterium]